MFYSYQNFYQSVLNRLFINHAAWPWFRIFFEIWKIGLVLEKFNIFGKQFSKFQIFSKEQEYFSKTEKCSLFKCSTIKVFQKKIFYSIKFIQKNFKTFYGASETNQTFLLRIKKTKWSWFFAKGFEISKRRSGPTFRPGTGLISVPPRVSSTRNLHKKKLIK